MLLEAKADVSAVDRRGLSVLHSAVVTNGLFAVSTPLLSCIEVVVRAGAVVDVANPWGETPLKMAIERNLRGVVEYLLDVGARCERLPKDNALPDWVTVMVNKRQRCRDCCRTFYGVLRKRWLTARGERVPRDMINVLTRMLWESRRDAGWQEVQLGLRV